jgi:hypothetical protein
MAFNKAKVKYSKRTAALGNFMPEVYSGSYVVKPVDVIRGLYKVIRNVAGSNPTSPNYIESKNIQTFIIDLFSRVHAKGFSSVYVRQVVRETL